MVVKIAAHLVILGLHILEVLLACIEIVLPTSTIVTAIAKEQKNLKVNTCLFVTYFLATAKDSSLTIFIR